MTHHSLLTYSTVHVMYTVNKCIPVFVGAVDHGFLLSLERSLLNSYTQHKKVNPTYILVITLL